jgi:diguanylate cyclase (GGDEF)-like protein
MDKIKTQNEITSVSEITETEIGEKEREPSFRPIKSYPSLIIISGSESIGKIYKLKNNVTIGRGVNVHIKLNDITISREHSKISLMGKDKVYIEDCGSKNGTIVNGVNITSTLLNNGDKIKIGNTIFKFGFLDELEKDFQYKIFSKSIEDDLTGIYNKTFFLEDLSMEFSYARRHKFPLSLVVFDIDNFKKINDTYGHLAGDFILKELVNIINKTKRKEDIFARIGGEEFGLILKNINKDHALNLAERIRKLIQNNQFKFKTIISVTISAGCDTYTEKNYKNYNQFFDTVDKLLLKAKSKGKNCVVCE